MNAQTFWTFSPLWSLNFLISLFRASNLLLPHQNFQPPTSVFIELSLITKNHMNYKVQQMFHKFHNNKVQTCVTSYTYK